jgi:pilus assembly protein CpaB
VEDKKTTEILEGRLSRNVQKGEPILKSALISETRGNFVAATLGKGMRAVAINVKAANMVGGFATPGDYVDVILTYKKSIKYEGPDNPDIENMIERNLDSYATETVLQNVKVLAVDQSTSMVGGGGGSGGEGEKKKKDKDGKVKVGKTVTLEVDIKGAEVLALSSRMGDLSLALRGIGDDRIITEKVPVTTDARITNIFDEVLEEIRKTQVNSGQVSQIVRIYRGEKVEDLPVNQ